MQRDLCQPFAALNKSSVQLSEILLPFLAGHQPNATLVAMLGRCKSSNK